MQNIEKTNLQNKKPGALDILLSIFFVFILMSAGVVNFILHTNNEVSSDENRELAMKPVFSVQSYFDGSYTMQIDDFLRDQFFARKYCVDFSRKSDTLKGYGYVATIGGQNEGGEETSLTFSYYYVDDFCFYNFIRNTDVEQQYANILEKFAKEHSDINIYNVMVPNSVAYVAEDLKEVSDDPFDSVDFYTQFYKNVQFIDVREEFSHHLLKELFFKTDHHWNGDGSYAAYNAFCKMAGYIPIDKKDMKKLEYEGMLGSLYNMTHNEKMKSSPDTLIVYEPIYPVEMHRFYKGENGEDIVLDPAPFCVSEIIMGDKPSYGIYLGGDMPRCVIKRKLDPAKRNSYDQYNGRKIDGIAQKAVLVKDSFGNAFSTLITQNYDEVHIIDPRSWSGDLYKYAFDIGAKDIIFLNTTSTSANIDFVKKIDSMVSAYTIE